MRTIRPIIAATVLGLSLTTTAACGSSGADGKSASSPTAFKTFSLKEVTALPQQQLDRHKNVKITMSMKTDGEQTNISMVMAITGGKPDFDMTIDEVEASGKSEKSHLIQTGTSMFMETRPGQEPPEPGKPWYDLAAAGSKDPMGSIMKVMGQMYAHMANPKNSMLGIINQAPAGANVSSAKEEVLNGRRALHYTITVNMEELVKSMDMKKLMSSVSGMFGGLAGDEEVSAEMAKLDKLSDAELAKMREEMLADVKGQILTQELWVDAENLPIKAIMNMPADKGEPAEPMELTYADWGKSAVVAPPADQISKKSPDLFG